MPYFAYASLYNITNVATVDGGSGVRNIQTNASVTVVLLSMRLYVYSGALDCNAGTVNVCWDMNEPRLSLEGSAYMMRTFFEEIQLYFEMNSRLMFAKKKER